MNFIGVISFNGWIGILVIISMGIYGSAMNKFMRNTGQRHFPAPLVSFLHTSFASEADNE